MTYPSEYYKYKNQLNEVSLKKEKFQQLLEGLESDYATLHECKQMLSEGSGLLDYLITQCGDINNAFDRNIIEGRYDSCKISFENKESVFENLSNFTESTNTFISACESIKSQLDEYGKLLDTHCIDIADETQNTVIAIDSLNEEMFNLRSSIDVIERMTQ